MLQFLAGNQFSRLFQKDGEDTNGLRLGVDPQSVFAQFFRAEIDLEGTEANC
jgi:hypothetical protein